MMKCGVALSRPTQTRARASTGAPHPAAGRSGGVRWSGDGTVHNGAAPARRRRSPACGGRHPSEPDVPSRQGGQPSGAAEEGAPEGRVSAGEPLHNGGRGPQPTNRPARVAMRAMGSHTAGPARAAARLADARSLAAPVPSGTSVPNAPTAAHRVVAEVRPPPRPGFETRLRGRRREVYAVPRQPGTGVDRPSHRAGRMPDGSHCQTMRVSTPGTGSRSPPANASTFP